MTQIKLLKRLYQSIPLRLAMVVPFVLQTVGAVAIVGSLAYQSGQQAVENLANQLLQQTSERVSDRLNYYLHTPQQLVAINRLAVAQGTLNLQNREQLRQHLWQQITLNPSLPTIGFWSEKGIAIGYVRMTTADSRKLAEQISGQTIPAGTVLLIDIQPNQRRYFWTDAQGKPGKLVYQLKDDFRSIPWYRHARSLHQQSWTPVSLARVIPVLQTVAAAPVRDASGKLQGIFTANYLLSEISLFLHQIQFSPSGHIFIMEGTGALVATSFAPEASGLRPMNGKSVRLTALESQDERTREIARQVIQQFGDFASLKSPQSLRLTAAGERQFVQITPYSDSYGLTWHVVTVLPESDFMTEIQQSTRTTALLCLLALVVAIASGWGLANRVTARITRINRASQALADGNLTQRLPEDSPITEVTGLAQAFNQMANQLQQFFEQLQDALATSEEKFAKIFRTSPDPVGITDLVEGRFLEVNQRMVEFFGYTREEMIGRTALDLGLWANLEERQQFRVQLETQRYVYNQEVTTYTKAGDRRIVLLAAEAFDLKGQDTIIFTLRDISDRKQLEFALQHSEAKTRAILDSTSAAIASLRVFPDRTWQIDQVSAGCEAITGYTAAELTLDNHLWVKQIEPEDWQAIVPQMFAKIFAAQSYTYEYRLHHKDGSLRWIAQTNNSWWDEAQQSWIVTAISVDITARKQAEIALCESEERLRVALDAAQMGCWDWHIETNQIIWSESLERLMGLQPGTFDGRLETVIAMIYPDDRQRVSDAINRSMEQGDDYNVEFRFVKPDGSIRWAVSKGNVLRDQSGSAVRMVGVDVDITDRKRSEAERHQAELALREREAQFQALATASPGIIYTVVESLHGPTQFEFLSPAFETIHEIPVAAVYRDASLVFNQMHPDDRQAYQSAVQHSLTTMQPFRHEWRIMTPSGRIKWLYASSRPSRCDNGDTVWHGVVIEITDRKTTELALQQSEAKFQALAAASPAIIFTLVEDNPGIFHFEYLSPVAAEIHEISIADLLQNGALTVDQIHPDDRAGYWQGVAHCLETMQPFQQEWRIITPSGKTKWLNCNSRLQRRETGEIVAHGIVLDVTARRQVELALRQSERKFKGAFDTINTGMALIGITGGFQEVNTTLCQMLGCTEAELLALRLEDIIHPQDQQIDLPMLSAMLAGDISGYQIEKRFLTKPGNVRWGLLNLAFMRDPDDRLLYLIAQITDISDRKQAEQELQQAKEAAEAANWAKTAFLASMSHELRTPLNSILGFSQLMLHGAATGSPEREYLTLVYNSGNYLLKLINEILDLSKIEAGKLTLQTEPIDLFQYLYLVRHTLSERISRKNLYFQLKIDPAVPQYIEVDGQKLEQVLFNLLSNAIKFTKHGGITLRVNVGDREIPPPTPHSPLSTAPSSTLHFEVEDTGVGIDAQDLHLIFDAFTQALAGRQAQEGTGLGLTISRRLVQLMGGDITVRSVAGQGSIFGFTIPVTVTTQNSVQAFPRDRPVMGLVPNQPQYRILVVDDQSENRLLIAKLLTKVGLSVKEASTGEAALDLWQQWQPHLIWMDIRLPGQDGYAITRHIRAAEKAWTEQQATMSPSLSDPTHPPHFPTVIIALTAQALPEDRALVLAAGCNDYISKPFQAATLFRKMAEHLGIQFLYAEDSQVNLDDDHVLWEPNLTADDLAVMPQEWVSALHQAAVLCQKKAVEKLVQQISPEHAVLMHKLAKLADNFEFEQIMKITQAVLDHEQMI